MKHRSLLVILLSLTVLLSVAPLSAHAELPLYSEENAVFAANANGFGYQNDRIVGYNGEGVQTLVIPTALDGAGITAAAANMTQFFARTYPEITRLVLSEGITAVGDLSLHLLPNLQEIVLPSTVHTLQEGAFLGTAALGDLFLPNVSLIYAQNELPVEAGVTLHGYVDSYVQRFAAYHALPFEAIARTPSRGDVNADGYCNSTDARLILQHVIEKQPLSDEAASFADVDADGAVTSDDARLVLQHAVELLVLAEVSVPIRSSEGQYVHPAATAVVKLWYTETDSPYKEGTVEDPAALVAAANRLVANSYETYSALFHSHYTVRIEFTNPDGTRFVLQSLATYGWAVGETRGGIGNRKDPSYVRALQDALPKK